MNLDIGHVASGCFVLGRDVHCKFDYWPLAVSMPPTKICPQCKAAVHVRWKTCESYTQSILPHAGNKLGVHGMQQASRKAESGDHKHAVNDT